MQPHLGGIMYYQKKSKNYGAFIFIVSITDIKNKTSFKNRVLNQNILLHI